MFSAKKKNGKSTGQKNDEWSKNISKKSLFEHKEKKSITGLFSQEQVVSGLAYLHLGKNVN